MDDFFCKLNEETYLIVDSKLRDRDCNPEDLDQNTFFNWVDNANKLTTLYLNYSSFQTPDSTRRIKIRGTQTSGTIIARTQLINNQAKALRNI